MKQVTVNLKLDIISAISCADLLTKQGIDTTKQAMSTTIRVGLETLTEFLRDRTQLPDYDSENDDALVSRFNELFKEQISEVKNLDFGGLGDFKPASQRAVETRREDIVSEVMRRTEGDSTPQIRTSSEERETEDIQRGQDIFKLDSSISFAEIKEQDPDNLFVVRLCEKPDPVFQKALEIIYGNFKVSEWLSQPVVGLINNLRKEHRDEI